MSYDIREMWAKDLEALKTLGSSVLADLNSGVAVDTETLKRKFEAIRVHNTTIRTDIAIEKLRATAEKSVVKPVTKKC